MASLVNKKILLGVSGGIAAYKTPEIVRLLKKQGAHVQVITTPSALKFVTKETLATVSGNPVFSDFFTEKYGLWNNHVELGMWPDLFVVAPATANSIAKMASGASDNLLLATYLSSRSKVMVVPAMDLDMMAHETTGNNLKTLETQGCLIMEPETGELASGLIGKGRMPEPAQILEFIENHFKPRSLFAGKKVLITAGPTQEKIDPVRFIGNYSTGKMGFALAKSFSAMGADVHLVTGPVNLESPEFVNIYRVTSALEMLQECQRHKDADIMVMAAAVADYRVVNPKDQKIKKSEDNLTVVLTKNPDILKTLAAEKTKYQFVVGFALETENEIENAKNKLVSKNLDMIVLNSMNDSGAGFGHDTNKVTLIFSDNEARELPLMSKIDTANQIVEQISHKLNLNNNTL